jgi:hypothetical protein
MVSSTRSMTQLIKFSPHTQLKAELEEYVQELLDSSKDGN